jgi:hypothetical protein
MSYEAVYLYDRNNQFVGAAIKKADVLKLESVNIWTQEDSDDFQKTLTDLNNEQLLRAVWPDADDPQVEELVLDPDWEPLELHEEDVIDWDASNLVDDEYGGIDFANSDVVYKKAMVPDPTEAQNRYYKAQETVARRRVVDNSTAT